MADIKSLRYRRAAGITLVGLLLAAAALIAYKQVVHSTRITAHFTSATAIYPGDQVKVSGVRVGKVISITPRPGDAVVELEVEHGVPLPVDVKAVIVAQNLVAARYVQLTPAYEDRGPTMNSGAVIPIERTAVPVEWDQVKDQLMRLANDLGPRAGQDTGPAGRFIDATANALQGNGPKLRESLAQLSGVARILADGSGDIVEFVSNLQKFVTALRDSKQEIVEFEGRLATLSSVLDGSKSDLDAALSNLSIAVVDVKRFVSETRDKTTEQVKRLSNVTQVLSDHQEDVEQLLHIFPTSLSNFYNIYDPITGTEAGTFGLNQYANPVEFTCAAFAAAQPNDPGQGVKKCAEYLGPLLRLVNPISYLNLNYLPIPVNPIIAPSPTPDQLIYSEPRLMPGPGAVAPNGPPPPPTTDQMLLPAEGATP